jgi:hypothetical protein
MTKIEYTTHNQTFVIYDLYIHEIYNVLGDEKYKEYIEVWQKKISGFPKRFTPTDKIFICNNKRWRTAGLKDNIEFALFISMSLDDLYQKLNDDTPSPLIATFEPRSDTFVNIKPSRS